MRMRPLIPCLLAPALLAQAPGDPAETRMAQVKADQDPALPRFLWLHPKGQVFQGAWGQDSDVSRAIADQELGNADFSEGEAESWARRLGWGPGDHWLLLSPEGEPLISGTAAPQASALLDAMRGTGWTPRVEELSQFLREHPENGDAWAEALLDVAAYAGRQASIERRLAGQKMFNPEEWLNPPPLPAEEDQARWGSTVEALNGLMSVDGWERHRKLPEILVHLEVGGARGSTLLKDPLQRMRHGAEEALQRDPVSTDLWTLWSFLTDLAPGGNVQALMSGLTSAPRQAWPPFGASGPIGDALAKAGRWPELEAIASQAYAQGMDPSALAYRGQDARMQVLYGWGAWRVAALVKMGRREELAGILDELRAASGSQWPDYAGRVLADSLAYNLGPDDPVIAKLKAAKDEPPPPDPPKPAFPLPLHLVLVGHPAWEKEWIRYAGLSTFDGWEPGEELEWQPLKPAEEQALRARMRWGAEPRWALMRGSEVLASGASLPKPLALADRLRAKGKPYLEQLDAFIRTHPDRLDAREARLDELRGRMPNERLEGALLEDARLTLKPFDPGQGTPMNGASDWTPREELWAPAARKAMPELEARIRHWPERYDFWQAWFDWNAVMEHPSSPVQLLDGFAIWKTRFDGGPGPLPGAILTLGSNALSAQARWKELADWCERFWEGGVRDVLRRASQRRSLSRKRPELFWEQKANISTGLLIPYRTALEKLGRAARLRAFMQELSEVDPSAAASFKASSTPPRPAK